jgi:glycosyltransferase involved in cell wall biosynthesis
MDSLVSIIIPTYNGGKHIERAIDSVLKQTYKNIEIIVIDDGSTDETPEIIGELSKKEPKIVVIINETNIGFVKSLNKGVGEARGKYIARLDDDDSWCDSKKLEKQVRFLEKNKDFVLVGGGIIKIDEDNREIGRYLFPKKDKDIRKSILIDNLFAHSTVLVRKDVWEKVEGYNEQFGFFADMDLWLKIGRMGKFYNFQEYFTYYLDKETAGNYSMRNKDIRRKLGLLIRLRKKYRNDYPGYKKAYLFCWASYFYSFLPFKQKLRPALLKLRGLIIGPPAYKCFKK